MKAAGKILKQAVVGLLDGNIGAPIFDGKVEADVFLYVLIGIVSERNVGNKTFDATEIMLGLAIVNVRHATAQSEAIENVDNEIRELMNTEPGKSNFTLPSGFNLDYCFFDTADEERITEIAPAKFAHTKRLTYKIRITQN